MLYPPSELVLNSSRQVYHLGLSPDQIAETILLVGDQDRVQLVSSFFDEIIHQSQHREFKCHTGFYKGKKMSVLSTGIGTDNIDITINELDALMNIDLTIREEKREKKSLKLIRIGTCGILQSNIPVHSYILTTHAFGLDNVAHFYQVNYSPEEMELCSSLKSFLELPESIEPYLCASSEALFKQLDSEKTFTGITVTSSGFYGPQGRKLRLKNKISDLNEKLTSYKGLDDRKVTNFEMESSALFALGKSLGHECATICLGVANRPNNEFSKGYETEMKGMIQYVLDRL
jgi:uridine phosphorylase